MVDRIVGVGGALRSMRFHSLLLSYVCSFWFLGSGAAYCPHDEIGPLSEINTSDDLVYGRNSLTNKKTKQTDKMQRLETFFSKMLFTERKRNQINETRGSIMR